MKKTVFSLAVLGIMALDYVNADPAPMSAPVKLEDISRVVVDRDEQIDAKKLFSQLEAMFASNAGAMKRADFDGLKISMFQAKVAEHVLAAAAKKVNLQNEAQVKEQIEALTRQILVRAYIAKVMKDRIKPEDVQKAYEEYKKGFATPKPGIEVGNILVADEATAKKVIELLNKGEKFAEVAKQYSIAASKENGGSEDVVPVDSLPPQMAGLKALEAGQHLKEPFKSPAGYHIVAVLSKKNVEALPFEKIRRTLEAELFRVELEKLIKTLLKTINVKAYNDKGEEIDIQKILAEPANLGEAPTAAPIAAAPAPAVEEPVQTPAAATSTEKKTEDDKKVDAPVAEKQSAPQETIVQKFFAWIKSLF